jgi:RNA polymerase sigma factor (sigma-70 family)
MDGAPSDQPSEVTLEMLMREYVEGSELAFDELYRRLTPKLFGYLLRLTRQRERAEDLLQITYSKIHRARGSYLEDAPLLPWVLAIARRAYFDEVRSRRARREDLSPEGVLPEPAPLHMEDTGTDLVDRALSQLPEAYREAIVLTKITGLSLAEAAAVVDSTPSALKLRVHRGYKVLREVIERLTSDEQES